jgi:PEGA domain
MRANRLLEDSAVSTHKRVVIAAALAIAGLCATAATAGAQYRARPVVVRAPIVVGAYYSPYWLYDPWFGFGYQYPWGPYPYAPYRVYDVDPGAAMRLEVKPHEAEVYVDGYYAGIVDDFDGTFQRLRIRPGAHELTLFLDGYRTVHQKVYLTPRNTFKVKYVMEPLAAGEQPEPRPQPMNPPQQAGPPAPIYPPPGRGPATRRAPQGPPPGPQGPPPGAQMPGPPRGGEASAYGTLAIRVQPSDAEVVIDGEVWRAPADQDRLVVEVAEGSHGIEIRKAGYRAYATQVQVRRGETTPINVSLRSQEEQ